MAYRKLKNEIWQINSKGKDGVSAETDIAFGLTEDSKSALRLDNKIITGDDINGIIVNLSGDSGTLTDEEFEILCGDSNHNLIHKGAVNYFRVANGVSWSYASIGNKNLGFIIIIPNKNWSSFVIPTSAVAVLDEEEATPMADGFAKIIHMSYDPGVYQDGYIYMIDEE